jgi:hypothetical protein
VAVRGRNERGRALDLGVSRPYRALPGGGLEGGDAAGWTGRPSGRLWSRLRRSVLGAEVVEVARCPRQGAALGAPGAHVYPLPAPAVQHQHGRALAVRTWLWWSADHVSGPPPRRKAVSSRVTGITHGGIGKHTYPLRRLRGCTERAQMTTLAAIALLLTPFAKLSSGKFLPNERSNRTKLTHRRGPRPGRGGCPGSRCGRGRRTSRRRGPRTRPTGRAGCRTVR